MTLMESLPPVDWEKLATKEDLGVLREDVEAVEERLNVKIELVRADMKPGLARHTFVTLAGLAAAMAPIYFELFGRGGG